MSIRYVTVSPQGEIYEITHFYDKNSRRTRDPLAASTCIIKLDESISSEADIDDVPIYTVH